MTDTYSDRREEEIVVKSVTYRDETAVVETTSSTGFGIPVLPGMEDILVGETLVLETRGFSQITGLKRPGQDWWFRKSDADLTADHQKMVAGFRRRNEELYEEHHEEWAAREAALPEDLRSRLEFFRSKGGHEFDVEGWAYELIICELADLYRTTGGENLDDSPEVTAFAEKHGTSGNQHGVAKLLVQAMAENYAASEVPAGLAPLTGNRDYSPKE